MIPEQRQAGNAFNISLAVSVLLALVSIVLIFQNDTQTLLLAVPGLIASAASARLARRGRHILGSWLIIAVLSATGILSQLLQRGQGLYIGIIVLSIIGSVAFNTLPRRFAGGALAMGLLSAILILALDQFGSAERPISPVPLVINVIFSAGTFVVLSYFVLREFATLNLRTKIVLGILSTGGTALLLLSFFALNRAGEITSTLSERLETSVSLLAEEQLVNLANQESDVANQFFEELMEDVERLAEYRVALQSQRASLNRGDFWNAEARLVALGGGQYGNSARDVSSVFVPVTVELNEAVIAELNTSAYLDLTAPQILADNSAVLAVYYIDRQGVVR